jgi:hypothetical protein
MRLKEFITESVTGQDVLSYIQRTHHEPLTTQLSQAVLQQPEWELRSVPLQDLHIPDQGYDDDPEYEPAADPYDRVQDIDPEHAGEVSIHNVDRKPIVIDREGFIIDGNHRAWAAAELLGRDTIQAWVPVEQELTELLNQPAKVKGYVKNTQDDWSARFRSKNGSSYVVRILSGTGYPAPWRRWVEQGLGKTVDPNELVYVTFEQGGTAEKAGSVKVTGAGNSVEVAASVYQALTNYVNTYHPTYISYAINDSDSRVGVYDRGLRRLEYHKVEGRFGFLYLYSNENKVIDEEELDEFSNTDSGIRKALEKKGYKFLGSGVDQTAYLEPGTGYILKIFGTQGGKDFSQDQKMFFKFAKFCMKNQDNPFLPRFYGYESFEFKGKTYLQIRTEQLFKNKKLQQAVYELGAIVRRDQRRGYIHPDTPGSIKMIKKNILNAVKTPDRFELLIQTLNKLYSTGSKSNYGWDLHSDNIMVRKDGTPVINDPWVVFS